MKRLTIAALLALLVGVVGVSAQDGFLVNGIQQLVNAVTITATSQFLAPTGCTTVGYVFTGDTGTGICRSASGRVAISSAGAVRMLAVDDSTVGFQLGSGMPLTWSTAAVPSGTADARLYRSATKTVTFDDGAGGSGTLSVIGTTRASDNMFVGGSIVGGGAGSEEYIFPGVNGEVLFRNNANTSKLYIQTKGTPTCATNCGTSPTLSGSDSSVTLTMGATGSPASGFILTFAGTWPAAPQCHVTMALAGMAVGKMPLTVVTTTTTATVVTNGTAPANGDKYHFQCSAGA